MNNILYVKNADDSVENAALTLFPDGSLKVALHDVVQDPKVGVDFSKVPKPMLLPALTTTQRDDIEGPAEGSEIYNIATHQKEIFNGTAWVVFGTGGGSSSPALETITANTYDYDLYATKNGIWNPAANADLSFLHVPNDYQFSFIVNNANHALTINGGNAAKIAPTGLTNILVIVVGGNATLYSDYVLTAATKIIFIADRPSSLGSVLNNPTATTTLDFSSIIKDSATAWDAANKKYIIPKTATYRITMNVMIEAGNPGDTFNFCVATTFADNDTNMLIPGPNVRSNYSKTFIKDYTAGDALQLFIYTNSAEYYKSWELYIEEL